MIEQRPFGVLPDGRQVTEYTMKNTLGASVSVIDFGGIVRSICVPDKDGALADVALGFDTLEGYLADHGCMGDTVGRYGNRIAQGRFTLDGTTYQLACNNGKNHLHGGVEGFSRKLWSIEPIVGAHGDSLRMHYVSPDGEESFPGTLDVTVTYGWDESCCLSIRYEATTDRATLCNLTNHTYFNLAGFDHGTIGDHILRIEADAITPVTDEGLIPTGGYMAVAGTPFDMRDGVLLGKGLEQTADWSQMAFAGGYDHNYVLRKGEAMGLAARLEHPASGRVMEVLTDQPGVQLYTACVTDFTGGKNGTSFGRYSGLCLETQHFPDSPNNPQFIGTTVLRPGEKYDTTTIYAFRVRK
ncbi:MAG: galactose mutarotase [Clostridiales bacterium]|nr:galactose mutarotase [Clostridiales bacterium]